jgi:hypothetical protein
MLPPPSPSFSQICLTTPSTAAICQMSAVKAAYFCLTSKQLSPKYCTETSTDSLLSGAVTIDQLEENFEVKTGRSLFVQPEKRAVKTQNWYKSNLVYYLHNRTYFLCYLKGPWLFKVQKPFMAFRDKKNVAHFFSRDARNQKKITKQFDSYQFLPFSSEAGQCLYKCFFYKLELADPVMFAYENMLRIP